MVETIEREAELIYPAPIQYAEPEKHYKLDDLLKDFTGEYTFEEWDTGVPLGNEVW
jgi:hypothetical protein